MATLITAVASALAALGANRSANENKKAAQSQLLKSILDEYNTNYMFYSVADLSEHGIKVANLRRPSESEQDNAQLEETIRIFRLGVNEQRRYVKNYYFKVAQLYMAEYINDKFITVIANQFGFSVLFEVIEPWEAETGMIRKEVGDDKRYDVLRPFYEKIKNVTGGD